MKLTIFTILVCIYLSSCSIFSKNQSSIVTVTDSISISEVVVDTTLSTEHGAIEGYFISRDGNQPIPFANVFIIGTDIVAITDTNGYYKLLLEEGVYNIGLQSIGNGDTTILEQLTTKAGYTRQIDFYEGYEAIYDFIK